jgi:hypothetical protein
MCIIVEVKYGFCYFHLTHFAMCSTAVCKLDTNIFAELQTTLVGFLCTACWNVSFPFSFRMTYVVNLVKSWSQY